MLGITGGKLYRQVYSDTNLTEAWRKVKGGTEMAGVDEITVDEFEARLFANLKTLQVDLRQRQYYPQPVKRIYLHEADGTK